MAVERCDDFARLVNQSAAQEPSVEVAGRLRIELVNALDEERFELQAFTLVAKFDGRRIQGFTSPANAPLP